MTVRLHETHFETGYNLKTKTLMKINIKRYKMAGIMAINYK